MENIKKIFTILSGDKKMIVVIVAVVAPLVSVVVLAGKGVIDGRNLQASVAGSIQDLGTSSDILGVATVGGEMAASAESVGSSWPGKIVSFGNIPVQPEREGNLVEWRVKIGQWVNEGQVLGKLSAPPRAPELVAMLAEKAEMLARTKAQAETTEVFTGKTTAQLKTLLASYEKTDSTAKDKDAVTLQKQNLRVFIEQTLFKHGSMVGGVTDPYYFRNLNKQYGQSDQSNQNAYELAFRKLAAALREPETFPFELAREYFVVAVRLANTTIGSSEIADIRMTMRDDQEKFLTMLSEITMKSVEYDTMRREIQEKIADNERMLAMAQAEVKAAEAAYNTVERSINGSLLIVAPRSGTISTIMKNVGEFVGPGMPVASINAGNTSERFVRFSIPSNIKLPKIGESLSVVRPGFSQDIQKIKLSGIGTSLDVTGMYMADATFLKPVDWPVDASVRVIAPQSGSEPIIPFSSVWWGAEGAPYVWGVSEAGRVFAKKIIIGRTLGTSVEVYEGLKNGDRYIVSPTTDIREDMLVDDVVKTTVSKDGATAMPVKSNEHAGHEGMEGM